MTTPLTPEERASKLWEEYQQLWGLEDNWGDSITPTDEQEATLFAKHIAAAVADARKDEREKIAMMFSPHYLRVYADAIDKMHPNDANPEVQDDLRRLASEIEAKEPTQ